MAEAITLAPPNLLQGRRSRPGCTGNGRTSFQCETFQDFSTGHMLLQAGNMHACHLQANISAGDV